MRFVKMHGLGNDFVIVPRDQLKSSDISSIASNISNRNTGIGCDQFVVYEPCDLHHYKMWIYNNDGSLAGACGNATRCMMKLLHMEYGIDHVELDVLGRKIGCRVLSDDKFEANMGKVSFDEPWMPTSEKIWGVMPSAHVREAVCADLGNKHLALFVDEMTEDEKWMLGKKMERASSLDLLLSRRSIEKTEANSGISCNKSNVSPRVLRSPNVLRTSEDDDALFPAGVNVNIAQIRDDHIDLKVWERQVGFTLACGSGACATVAAASKLGLVKDEAKVHFSKGILDISLKDGDVYMAGPATFVGRGECESAYCHPREDGDPVK